MSGLLKCIDCDAIMSVRCPSCAAVVGRYYLLCVDCKEAITHDSWVRYFGPYRDGAVGSFEYHCGCDGTEERLLLLLAGKGDNVEKL